MRVTPTGSIMAATVCSPMKEASMRAEDRRKVVDKVAAAVMLQHWLDGRPRPQDRPS
mgnify:CR=1 FL=1